MARAIVVVVAMNLAIGYAQKIGSLHSGQSAGCEPFGAMFRVSLIVLNLMVMIFMVSILCLGFLVVGLLSTCPGGWFLFGLCGLNKFAKLKNI